MNTGDDAMLGKKTPRLIAFYLPQFHPIPENDAAWGTGFTEWNNVVKAKPKFRGHHQPHLPKDFGFYDLRLDQTRDQQAKMAGKYGIDAFCYYSYWFDNHPILGLPLELEMSADHRYFPICLCWANENWTRAWDGRDADLIIKQDYSAESLNNYCIYLAKKFLHNKYLKIDRRPVFLVYSPDEIPASIDFPGLLRGHANNFGIQDIYMIAVKHGRAKLSSNDYIKMGYNEVLLFQPNKNDFTRAPNIKSKIKAMVRSILPNKIFNMFRLKIDSYQSVSYAGIAHNVGKRSILDYEIPCVFPSWDNSARRTISTVIQNDNPKNFGLWLYSEMRKAQKKVSGLNAVFINAWNEWAEGCHLEPDQVLGNTYLEWIGKCKDAITDPNSDFYDIHDKSTGTQE